MAEVAAAVGRLSTDATILAGVGVTVVAEEFAIGTGVPYRTLASMARLVLLAHSTILAGRALTEVNLHRKIF